jgi:branched-chain amino acid aminotransferase
MTQVIQAYKITRSDSQQLDFDLPDFDSITTALPSGLYTTFRTYSERTKVVGLRAHLDRLYLPAKVQGIVPAIRRQDDLRQTLAELLGRFDAPEARVRLILDVKQEPGTIYVLLQPMKLLPPEIYREGVSVEISKSSRKKPSLKQTAYISESAFDRTRVGGGVFEILLTSKGRILEGITSNFFYVLNGVLCTAGRGVLIGVTRQTVLALAKKNEIEISYKALPLNDIPLVDESFLTSSSRGLVPVVRVDGQLIEDGTVGDMTRKLCAFAGRRDHLTANDLIQSIHETGYRPVLFYCARGLSGCAAIAYTLANCACGCPNDYAEPNTNIDADGQCHALSFPGLSIHNSGIARASISKRGNQLRLYAGCRT